MTYYLRITTENQTVGDVITNVGNFLWNLETQTIIDVFLTVVGVLVVLAVFVFVAGTIIGLLQAARDRLDNLWQATFDKETPNDWRIYTGWAWPVLLVAAIALGIWAL